MTKKIVIAFLIVASVTLATLATLCLVCEPWKVAVGQLEEIQFWKWLAYVGWTHDGVFLTSKSYDVAYTPSMFIEDHDSGSWISWHSATYLEPPYNRAAHFFYFRVSSAILVMAAVATAFYPLLTFVRGRATRWGRRRKAQCVWCCYDLTGNISGVCPECGKPAPKPRP